MQIKKITAFGASFRRCLFPIRHNWRFWIALFGPVPLAIYWPDVIEPTLLNTLLFIAFYYLVVNSFTKFMLKAQISADRRRRAEWRAEVEREIIRLQMDYNDIVTMVRQLPPEVQAEHFERLKGFAFKLLTLNRLLEDWRE